MHKNIHERESQYTRCRSKQIQYSHEWISSQIYTQISSFGSKYKIWFGDQQFLLHLSHFLHIQWRRMVGYAQNKMLRVRINRTNSTEKQVLDSCLVIILWIFQTLTSFSSSSCLGIKAVSTLPFLKSCKVKETKFNSFIMTKKPYDQSDDPIHASVRCVRTSMSRISLWYSMVVGTPAVNRKHIWIRDILVCKLIPYYSSKESQTKFILPNWPERTTKGDVENDTLIGAQS